MCENILVSVLSEFGTVYRQALLVSSRYCRSEILWVMPTLNLGIHTKYWSMFLLSLYLVFKLLLFCVYYFYMYVSADCVACKWRYPPFVTLILNK